MNIDCSTLEARFRDGFPRMYRRFAGFIDSGDLWTEAINVMKEADTLSHIKFCNDVMRIPPVRSHLMLSECRGGPAAGRDLSTNEKQALGAMYGFLFKDVLGYTQQESVSCKINTVKMASLFMEPRWESEFVEEASGE